MSYFNGEEINEPTEQEIKDYNKPEPEVIEVTPPYEITTNATKETIYSGEIIPFHEPCAVVSQSPINEALEAKMTIGDCPKCAALQSQVDLMNRQYDSLEKDCEHNIDRAEKAEKQVDAAGKIFGNVQKALASLKAYFNEQQIEISEEGIAQIDELGDSIIGWLSGQKPAEKESNK